jgi:hypothetical protein
MASSFKGTLTQFFDTLKSKEAELVKELGDMEYILGLMARVQGLEAQVREAHSYAPLDDEASLLSRARHAEDELERLDNLGKRKEDFMDLEAQLGEARLVWCEEELAQGEADLAKREKEAAEELAALELVQTRASALKVLEKQVMEARKVLDTV